MRFKVVKVSGVGLLALWKEKKVICTAASFCSVADLPLPVGKAKVVNYTQRLIWPRASSPAVLLYACSSHSML